MPNDKAGELFKHILDYVNDKNPVTDDLIIQLTFEPIKQQLKRDLIKWEDFIKKQSDNGKLGGRPKTQTNPENPTLILDNPTEPKKAVNVTVTDNVKVNDTVSDKEKEKKKKRVAEPSSVHPSFGFIKKCFLDFYLEKTTSEYYWQPKDGVATNNIIPKLIFKIKEKNPAAKKENEAEDINKAFKYFASQIKDKWILENLSMPILNSKFNEIINQILNPLKNGKSTDNTAADKIIFSKLKAEYDSRNNPA